MHPARILAPALIGAALAAYLSVGFVLVVTAPPADNPAAQQALVYGA